MKRLQITALSMVLTIAALELGAHYFSDPGSVRLSSTFKQKFLGLHWYFVKPGLKEANTVIERFNLSR
jgi:hypothetical protein